MLVYVKSGSNYYIHGIVAARLNPEDGQVASTMYTSPITYAEMKKFEVKKN